MNKNWSIGLAAAWVAALLLNLVELKTITGLPAHPLLLHMPVIFIPSLTIAAVVFALKPEWRKRYAIPYGIGAVVTMAGTALAVGAGEAWKEQRGRFADSELQHHASLGGNLRIVVIVFTALVLVQVLADLGAFEQLNKLFEDPADVGALVLTGSITALALLGGGLTYATGHAGAEAAFGNDVGGRTGGSGLQQNRGQGQFNAPQSSGRGEFRGQYFDDQSTR
ncbi:MAG: hypothetical protein QM648_11695 [Solirubrobacterales bacterium]